MAPREPGQIRIFRVDGSGFEARDDIFVRALGALHTIIASVFMSWLMADADTRRPTAIGRIEAHACRDIDPIHLQPEGVAAIAPKIRHFVVSDISRTRLNLRILSDSSHVESDASSNMSDDDDAPMASSGPTVTLADTLSQNVRFTLSMSDLGERPGQAAFCFIEKALGDSNSLVARDPNIRKLLIDAIALNRIGHNFGHTETLKFVRLVYLRTRPHNNRLAPPTNTCELLI